MLFDNVLIELEEIFLRHENALNLRSNKSHFFVNRDLRGRIALVWDAKNLEQMDESLLTAIRALCTEIDNRLRKHALSAAHMPIEGVEPFEADQQGAVVFSYGDRLSFTVVDRMLTESFWSIRAAEDSLSRKMTVFYSIKGGVGRSTALAVAAWHLARQGKKVMVVDMDLESPGLSSSLLPADRCPDHGILDWLVEDVVENGDEVLERLFATSPLGASGGGEIFVIPAHGKRYGDYIAKMGRAWMHRMDGDKRIPWSQRLRILLCKLNAQHNPDHILIDARAGLDEIASASVLDLAPRLVLLFALESTQTWTGYSILFNHWNTIGQTQNIREYLQVVAAMIPPLDDKQPYMKRLREKAWDCFMEQLYDDLSAGKERGDAFSFDCNDEGAPHNPWIIHWHQGLNALKDLHTLDGTLDPVQLNAIFPFLHDLDVFFEEQP